jgi:hypothetical protein
MYYLPTSWRDSSFVGLGSGLCHDHSKKKAVS